MHAKPKSAHGYLSSPQPPGASMQLTVPLVLASRSPRRIALLRQLGLDPEVLPADIDETSEQSDPAKMVRALAIKKCAAVARKRRSAIVLAADTTVAIDGDILEKPRDKGEAVAMLRTLSDRTHTVYTGVALEQPSTGRRASGVERTLVTFAKLSDHEIDSYILTGSSYDKAGGYGIQDDRGALLVSRIEGDYYNVVGLPLRRVYEMLKLSFRDQIIL